MKLEAKDVLNCSNFISFFIFEQLLSNFKKSARFLKFFQTINAIEFRFQKDPTDKFMNLFEKSVFKKSFKHVINTEMALIGCNFFIIQIDSIILFNIE